MCCHDTNDLDSDFRKLRVASNITERTPSTWPIESRAYVSTPCIVGVICNLVSMLVRSDAATNLVLSLSMCSAAVQVAVNMMILHMVVEPCTVQEI